MFNFLSVVQSLEVNMLMIHGNHLLKMTSRTQLPILSLSLVSIRISLPNAVR